MILKQRLILTLIIGLAFSLTGLSQTNNYPVIQQNGNKYYVYTVQPAEGLYSVSKRFNITQEEILAANPEIKDGLKNGQEIRIPIKGTISTTNTPAQRSSTFEHTVSPGETLYSISKTYGITVDELLQLNPGIENGIIKVGTIIKIAQQKPGNVIAGDYVYHTIEEGETLYSVSKKYGLATDDILSSNPGLSTVTFNTGKVIRLDAAKVEAVKKAKAEKEKYANSTFTYIAEKKEKIEEVAERFNVSLSELKRVNPDLPKKLSKGDKIQIPSVKPVIVTTPQPTISDTPAANLSNSVPKIAIMLPFALNDNSKKAIAGRERFTEYYEGLLMALSEAKSAGFSADIYVYDTKGSEEEVRKLLTKDEMKNMNLIIGPAFDEQVSVISEFSVANNIPLVIPFTSKNDSYQTNPNIFQINAPQSYLFPSVSKAFLKEFRNYNIIILKTGGTADDKSEFVASLTSSLKDAGISYKTVTMAGTGTSELESALTSGKNNIIVPAFGASATLDKYLPAVVKLKENKSALTIKLFGYPEWQTYSKSVRTKYLHPLDTYIYSTFYASLSSYSTSTFRSNFIKAYSKDIKPTFPKFGLLGYDTGKYFFGALQKYGFDFQSDITSFYQPGVQMDFRFERVNYWSGFINRSIYLIHFDPNSNVDATVFR